MNLVNFVFEIQFDFSYLWKFVTSSCLILECKWAFVFQDKCVRFIWSNQYGRAVVIQKLKFGIIDGGFIQYIFLSHVNKQKYYIIKIEWKRNTICRFTFSFCFYFDLGFVLVRTMKINDLPKYRRFALNEMEKEKKKKNISN